MAGNVQYEVGQTPACRVSPDEPAFPTITYSLTVRNNGLADSGPFVVDANGLAQVPVSGLGVGNSVLLEIAAIGSGENTVVVDAASQVEESVEENNTTRFVLVIPPQEPIPTCTPTPTPTHTPTPVPPTAIPTSSPTPLPTSTPTPRPTFTPTPVPPTATPTPTPTHTPTPLPTGTPTPLPTSTPMPLPPTATPAFTPVVVVVTATPMPVVEVTTETDDEGPNTGLLIAIPIVAILAIGIVAGLFVVYRRRTFGE